MDRKYPPDEEPDPEGETPFDSDEEQEEKRIECRITKSRITPR